MKYFMTVTDETIGVAYGTSIMFGRDVYYILNVDG